MYTRGNLGAEHARLSCPKFRSTWNVHAYECINCQRFNQMTVCDVKEVTHSDAPTKNYHPNLQFPLALQSFLAILWLIVLILLSATLLFWFTLAALISLVSSCSRQLFSPKSSDEPAVHYLHSSIATDQVIDWQVMKVEHLAAK